MHSDTKKPVWLKDTQNDLSTPRCSCSYSLVCWNGLTSDLLCLWGWPWAPDALASASQGLGLQVWHPAQTFIFVEIESFSVVRLAPSFCLTFPKCWACRLVPQRHASPSHVSLFWGKQKAGGRIVLEITKFIVSGTLVNFIYFLFFFQSTI